MNLARVLEGLDPDDERIEIRWDGEVFRKKGHLASPTAVWIGALSPRQRELLERGVVGWQRSLYPNEVLFGGALILHSEKVRSLVYRRDGGVSFPGEPPGGSDYWELISSLTSNVEDSPRRTIWQVLED